jgi:hypothetical protein
VHAMKPYRGDTEWVASRDAKASVVPPHFIGADARKRGEGAASCARPEHPDQILAPADSSSTAATSGPGAE